ncbi:MAG: ferrous iron transport protein A [Hydrococcus sp. C42_A2020_068]|nr:ferrous iron transport protein A [Hydrococcus sp. C42_A2020_068]
MKDSRKVLGWRFAFIGGTYHTWHQGNQKTEVAANSSEGELGAIQSFPLSSAHVGDRVWIVSLSSNSDNPYLASLGLVPGTQLQVIRHTARGSAIVACGDNRIGLGACITNTILVTNRSIILEDKTTKAANITYLRDLPVGTRGRVVGYDKAFRGYIGKLLSMGLAPGTEFTAIRRSFLGYPLQIEVGGSLLDLCKPEADALCIEAIEDETF